jgi:hypothetical protein
VVSSLLKFLKTAISWLAIVAGILLGAYGLARLGVEPVWGLNGPRPGSDWFLILGIAFLGLVPLVASFVALDNRKRAALLYLGGGAIVMLLALPSRAYPEVLTAAREASTILVVFGFFWLLTHMRGWPPIVPEGAWSLRVRIGVATLGCFIVLVLVSVGAIAISMSWEFPGDCGEALPFVTQRPGRAVFIARLVHVDRFLGAVAVVQEQFWGVPWHSKVVFLKAPGKRGVQYFVDGRLDNGLLTRNILPVIDTKCTGSELLQDAKVELRLLRGSPHWDGVRIIGRVLKLRGEQPGNPPLPGVRVIITGPAGITIAVTDQGGIYDVSGLASGRYSVRADVVEAFPAPGYSLCREHYEYPGAGLRPGDVWGCTLRVP